MCREVRGIDLLSIEILGSIFSWLDDDDLISVSSVCRLWYDVVNLYLLQRRQSAILRPEVTDFKPMLPLQRLSLIGFNDKRFKELNDMFIDLNRLHIGYDSSEDRLVNDTALSGLLKCCENLKTISFRNVLINDGIIQTILREGFNKLDSLTFECSTSFTSDVIKNILDKFLFLEFKLIIRRSEFECNLYAKYPFCYDSVTNIEIPKYITKLVMDCSGLSKNSYDCLKHCYKLQILKLFNAFNVEDNSIVSCFTHLPQLRKISFSDAKNITINGWKTLFNCVRLKSVVLVRCASGLSDDVFKEAKAGARRLDLDLQNCKRVTEEGLISAILLTERVSLILDYNEEQIERLEKFITLEMAPRLRCLDIAIQRLNATSYYASSHLNKFKTILTLYSERHDINFTYKELLTRSERNFQPAVSYFNETG